MPIYIFEPPACFERLRNELFDLQPFDLETSLSSTGYHSAPQIPHLTTVQELKERRYVLVAYLYLQQSKFQQISRNQPQYPLRI